MEDAYKVINDTLVSLINEIWRLEEKAIITEEFKDISNNDMHVIEALGLGEGGNMSSIARKLNEQPCEQKVRDQTAQRTRQKSCICEIDRAWRTCLPSPCRLSQTDDRGNFGQIG